MDRLLTKLCAWALRAKMLPFDENIGRWSLMANSGLSFKILLKWWESLRHRVGAWLHYVMQSCAQLNSIQLINRDVFDPVDKPGERLDTLLSTYLYEINCMKPFRWNPVLYMVTPLRRERKKKQACTKDSLPRTVNLTIWCLIRRIHPTIYTDKYSRF